MVCRTYLIIRLALLVLLAAEYLPAAQITESYTGPASSNWNLASHWSAPGAVPNNGGGSTYNVHIATTASATVSLDISPTIDNLTVDVGDALTISNTRALTVNAGASAGSIIDNGTITLNSTATATKLVLNNGTVTLSGSGSLTMSNNVNNSITGTGASPVLNNSISISGAGTISALGLSNSGTINANVSNALTINPVGTATNTGTLEATAGHSLILQGTYNNAGGKIQASGAGSQVQLNNGVSVTGGTITTTAGGVIVDPGTVTLTSLANSGTYQVSAGATTVLAGAINNAGGTFNVLTGAPGGALNISGSVALLGGGAISMFGTMQDNAGGNATLTTDNVFTGTGNIGNGHMTLISSGTIQSDQGGTLTIQTPGGFTNTGTVNVINSSTLAVTASGVTDNGGTTFVEGASLLNDLGFNYTQTGAATTTHVDGSILANLVDIKGGLLEGIGGLSGDLTVEGGAVNPLNVGVAPGTFSPNGNYVQTAGGTLDIELGASGFSQLAIGGTGTFAGALDVLSFGGFTPFDGETFQIVTYSSLISDNFAAPVSFISGFTFTQTPSSGFITLTAHQNASVPEPSTMLSLTSGLAALLLKRKWRIFDRA